MLQSNQRWKSNSTGQLYWVGTVRSGVVGTYCELFVMNENGTLGASEFKSERWVELNCTQVVS